MNARPGAILGLLGAAVVGGGIFWFEKRPRVDESAKPPERAARGAQQAQFAEGGVDGGGVFRLHADGGEAKRSPDEVAKEMSDARSLIKELGDGRLTIGEVMLEPRERRFSFPARINQHEGQVEYALVHDRGKVHEALLATGVSPVHLHVAALLLDFAVSGKEESRKAVDILVEWETNGPRRSHRLEELVALSEDSPHGPAGKTLEKGSWTYHGSDVGPGGFAAALEGNLISLIGDPSALMLNPRPTRADDGLHIPNARLLPSKGHPVRVLVQTAAAVPVPSR